MALGCPRPQEHSLRLGCGRLPITAGTPSAARCPAAKGMAGRGGTPPTFPRSDRCLGTSSAQRPRAWRCLSRFSVPLLCFPTKRVLAIDAAVGSGGRCRHRHDRTRARRHHCNAMVFGAPWNCGRHSHRKHGHWASWCFFHYSPISYRHISARIALAGMCGMLGLAALACGRCAMAADVPLRQRC